MGNIVADAGQPSCGESLFAAAVAGGQAASGLPFMPLATGTRADLVVLDDRAVELASRPVERVLDSFVFAGNRRLVRDVMAGGQWRVRDGQHLQRERIEREYRGALARVLRD